MFSLRICKTKEIPCRVYPWPGFSDYRWALDIKAVPFSPFLTSSQRSSLFATQTTSIMFTTRVALALSSIALAAFSATASPLLGRDSGASCFVLSPPHTCSSCFFY